MKLKRGEILFGAHAGWAASSAKLFGCPAYWWLVKTFHRKSSDRSPMALVTRYLS
jgi:hypothetical protein